jgi:hypothetical protein
MKRRRLLQALGLGAATSSVPITVQATEEPEVMHPHDAAFRIDNADGQVVFSVSKDGKVLEGLHPVEPFTPKPKPKPTNGLQFDYVSLEPSDELTVSGLLRISPPK